MLAKDGEVSAAIQATATVIRPLGITSPEDNYLTTRVPGSYMFDNAAGSIAVVENEKTEQLLLRFPSASGVLVTTETGHGEIHQFSILQRPGLFVLPDIFDQAEPCLATADCRRLLDWVPAASAQCIITLIYSEN